MGAYKALLGQLFDMVDINDSGSLSYGEIQDVYDEPKIQAFLKGLELHTDNAWTFFRMLVCEDEASIGLEEFVEGCMVLRGSAKQIDLIWCVREQQRFQRHFQQAIDDITCRLDDLQASVEMVLQ